MNGTFTRRPVRFVVAQATGRWTLNQYVYFALYSRDIPAVEMASVLGMEPDEIMVRGSRRREPRLVPACHGWKIVCREPGLRVDEQAARVLERLTPHAQAIADLAQRLYAADPDCGAVLQVVRYFNDEPGQQVPYTGRDIRAAGPDPIGWHLDREILDFLHATGAVLDVDEYDMTSDCAED